MTAALTLGIIGGPNVSNLSHQDAAASSASPRTAWSDDDLRVELYNFVERVGTQVAAAERLGVGPTFISEVLRGNRKVSEGIAQKLGFEAVRYVTWRRVAA